MRRYTAVMILVVFMCCFFITPSATAASDEEAIMQLVSDYFKGWNTNSNELMEKVHWNSPDFTFFGPNKDTSFLTKGWEETAEGFKTTFDSPVGTYSLSCHDPKVWMIEKNVAIVTMNSIWNITDTNTNELQIQQIRGTHVVKKVNGKWLILHVHWSILPTE